MAKNIKRNGIAPAWEIYVGARIEAISKALATLGGLVLIFLALLTLLSILGRQLLFLGLGPVPGDFEIMEIGCGFAVFSFLPWCQVQAGHAVVDIFVVKLGVRINSFLELLWNATMMSASGLIAWRMYEGALEKKISEETTLILQIPLWIGYAAGVMALLVLVIVCAFTVWRSLNDLISGRRVSV